MHNQVLSAQSVWVTNTPRWTTQLPDKPHHLIVKLTYFFPPEIDDIVFAASTYLLETQYMRCNLRPINSAADTVILNISPGSAFWRGRAHRSHDTDSREFWRHH